VSAPLVNALELALCKVVSDVIGNAANVYPGKASTTKVLPCVICAADGSSAEEDPPRTGNFWVDTETTVKVIAATEPGAAVDPVIAADDLTRAVFNALTLDNLDVLLNAAAQSLGLLLTVFPQGFFFSSPKQGRMRRGPGWMYCRAGFIAARPCWPLGFTDAIRNLFYLLPRHHTSEFCCPIGLGDHAKGHTGKDRWR